eukprot:7391409-Prymnesium_polylepis.2
MRWHESTKRIFDVIRKLGGPKTLRFINETLESPHERTVVRHWQQNKIDYTLGPDDVGWTRTWKEVAAIYEKMKADLTIQGPVLYELSEDETTVPTASQYNERRDSLVGSCGKRGEGHVCDPNLSIILGDGDNLFSVLEQHHKEQQLAGYLRLVVVNPLHEKLPPLAVVAHATCNRFTSEWIRAEWQQMEAMAEQHLSPKLGVLKGQHGSDGDARRFANMRRRMSAPPTAQGRFGLDAPGFTQSGVLKDGKPMAIDSQDPKHNIAKLYSHLSNYSRVVKMGNETASHQQCAVEI